jgi:murein L,D-transpeptidase YcbB/YkuD
MSARGVLSVVGTAVGGLIGWSDAAAPAADPTSIRTMFTQLGCPIGAGDVSLTDAVRAFQARVGLPADGIAGSRTVHLLARYAGEARELRVLDLAA